MTTLWDEIAERLNNAFEAVRAAKKMSWLQLAEDMDTTKTTLKNWAAGKHFPSRANWLDIERVTGISVDEFVLGEGRAVKVHQLRESLCSTPAEMTLLRSYRACNTEGRNHIMKQAEFAFMEYPQPTNVKQFPPRKQS